jgi:hypothetical protein
VDGDASVASFALVCANPFVTAAYAAAQTAVFSIEKALNLPQKELMNTCRAVYRVTFQQTASDGKRNQKGT